MRRLRFGLWYDFRNPPQWRQSPDRLYREILDQIVWGENNGFDDVWLSEHHFIEDGYLPSLLPAAAAIAARTKRIRPRALAKERRSQSRRARYGDNHDSRVHQQRPDYTLLLVDVAAWIAAAVGITSSRAVRLESDPCVSIANTSASRR